MNEANLYQLADILQVPLHRIGDGYKGNATSEIVLGGIPLELTLRVKSDVLTKNVASVFAYAGGDLWFYLVSENNGTLATLFVFNGGLLKLNKGFIDKPCSQGNLAQTIKNLRTAGAPEYHFIGGHWTPAPITE